MQSKQTYFVPYFVAFFVAGFLSQGCGKAQFGQSGSLPVSNPDVPGEQDRNGPRGPDNQDATVPNPDSLRPSSPSLTLDCSEAMPPVSLSTLNPSSMPGVADLSQRILEIPKSCTWTETTVHEPLKNLRVWLVLDVSGSMRTHIDKVRDGIAEIFRIYQEKGWNIEAAGVAFDDVIQDVVLPTPDIEEFLQRTSQLNPVWDTPPGKGGDVPEGGLKALSCALYLAYTGQSVCTPEGMESAEKGALGLLPLDSSRALESQWIIYVSDAPARNSKGTFDMQNLAQSMRDLSDLATKSGSELQFFAASKAGRRGLLPQWPEPLEQINSLVEDSGVNYQPMEFPVTPESVDRTFVAQARKLPDEVADHQCAVQEVGQITASGKRFNVLRSASKNETENAIQGPLKNLMYEPLQSPGRVPEPWKIYIQRQCQGSNIHTFEVLSEST